jgi:hypothetical protein
MIGLRITRFGRGDIQHASNNAFRIASVFGVHLAA